MKDNEGKFKGHDGRSVEPKLGQIETGPDEAVTKRGRLPTSSLRPVVGLSELSVRATATPPEACTHSTYYTKYTMMRILQEFCTGPIASSPFTTLPVVQALSYPSVSSADLDLHFEVVATWLS